MRATQLTRKKSEEEARLSLEALCVTGEHCVLEMRNKMMRWGVDDAAQERIIKHLVERGFIDEERYCRAFVKDKVIYNKWGRRKVEQALWAKRIPQEIIREALDEVDQENYVDTLRQLLKNKSRSVKASSEYERTQKLIRFAAGRGFTMDVIRQCLNTDYDEDNC